MAMLYRLHWKIQSISVCVTHHLDLSFEIVKSTYMNKACKGITISDARKSLHAKNLTMRFQSKGSWAKGTSRALHWWTAQWPSSGLDRLRLYKLSEKARVKGI
ncbi:hypothetical protein U1Q18_024805 [Sarracenia purpurea var. burkii]